MNHVQEVTALPALTISRRKSTINFNMYTPRSLAHHLIWVFKGIQVFALVGKSGTGKSFRARLIAEKHGIDLIIDDGLLIRDNKILAGRTAKREKGILPAIRTALFTDPEHILDVKRALKKEKFKRILVVGTSVKMARKITGQLELPHPAKIITIEEIATLDEIEAATRSRNSEGKHIIPVPAIEVKRDYPHIFLDSVKIFFKNSFRFSKKTKMFEKTVVRPEYSKQGKITISETAISQMVMHCVKEYDVNLLVDKIIVSSNRNMYSLEVIIRVQFGTQITDILFQLQDYILKNIERYTGLILKEVNITVGNVTGKINGKK